ncbi:tRNA uridine-5-carboxymethylaminomethyl(34) synthesis GTPase MnmE [Sneathiella chinensis]|uniref:tRNA modification GTPase MnmE n=1 Tax=Sneathiella chinensis TaxID=349750 RepID=A0ABQ5U369_9PROT|nr:tRNA uridine-5-carboxymethylaminomethyl(34) synthesis GTPase MnmE [Sneathiella chinensis]GLQ04946.1 tRNA modification GTPase MnmE [Sneathiella chinensis]
MHNDTIFALASGRGRAGVAVVRLSGPDAFAILEKLTDRPLPAVRRAAVRDIYSLDRFFVIDQALVLLFEGPGSFTGEDVVEIHLHGGPALITALFDQLIQLPDTRPADPGEYTRRAFEHGKLDLTEAEGLGDLVNAETHAQHQQALRQMRGELGEIYTRWREELISYLAHLEADIDFPDEDLPDGVAGLVRPKIAALKSEIRQHLADGHRGEKIREGLDVVILGAPNVGKSSLLNKLARREVAIVSEQAGTTRDIVEVHLDLAGYPVTIADTAGIREATDQIEQEGVRRARARAENADIRIFMTEPGDPPLAETEFGDMVTEASYHLINKQDLLDQADRTPGHDRQFLISVRTEEGLNRFLTRLEEDVVRLLDVSGAPSLTRVRHRQALEECCASLERFEQAPEQELAAEDVRLAARALGRITGRVDVEDILDVVFGDFCIGK